ncbi:glycosyl transferase [Rheinheimera sp. WS51]|uniref:glycosyl transferase n=1 Tax=Rheinheimera sp. WS51 TaxID=3425886 RepID=UPI003D8FC618
MTHLSSLLPKLPNQSCFCAMPSGLNFLSVTKAKTATHAVVILPPFAEEMNKSRHIIKQCTTQLAEHNYYSFMLDNYGTGDSEGDLDTATIELWRIDLAILMQKIADWGFQSVSFIAIRFGALQLFDLLNLHSLPLPIKHLVLWQPMFDASRFWQQFCRIKVAEAMASGEKTSQKQLEQQLEQGQIVEIAGYPINSSFVQSILQMESTFPAVLNNSLLSWFELSKLDNIALPVQKMRDSLTEKCLLHFNQIKAEAFWQTSELAEANKLIALTINQFAGAE